MATTTSIRDALAHAFEHHSYDVVLALLGFDQPSSSVTLPIAADVRFCGTRGALACYLILSGDVAHTARALRERNLLQLQICIAPAADFGAITIVTYALGEKLLTLTLDGALRHADVQTFEELIPDEGETGTALAARYGRALDRARITRRFFQDFAAQRDRVALSWTGVPEQRRKDRNQLALLLLSRLMFLYFLQSRGYLSGDRAFILRQFQARTKRRTFYVSTLKPLFFRVLNRRPERRDHDVFHGLPYLNGGLFERHALERRYSRLNLPDDCVAGVLADLLERYRFTTRESSDNAADGVVDLGVDPEMLGRVFEGLMAESVRESTGTFYTPAETVDRVVTSALDALPRSKVLREVRVLDPACGSGAFLLGALSRIASARAANDGCDQLAIRRELVATSLFGVDLQSDAALLCALRLWLSLVPPQPDIVVQPLPNLDRQIRQGDALIDPLDLKTASHDAAVRRGVNALQPLLQSYAAVEPENRKALQKEIAGCEKLLSRAWISAQRSRLDRDMKELVSIASQKDLFGDRTPDAVDAARDLRLLRERISDLKRMARRTRVDGDVPFFSFGIHFASAALHGFDLIVCNPPWVRSHNWTHAVPRSTRARFSVCNDGGRQVDLAMLFLERAIELLASGGVLGIILPAKFLRSQSARGARQLILRNTEIISLEDHSLDQRSVFEADAFTSILVLRKCEPPANATSSVTMIKRKNEPLRFVMRQADLRLDADVGAPWLIVPPDVRRVLEKLREAPTLKEHRLSIQRGIVTGNNGVVVLTRIERKIGDLMLIRAEGFDSAADPRLFEAVVEESAVAPLLRGADIRPNSAVASAHVLCRTARSTRTLPRAVKYAERHNARLPRFDCTDAKVVWHDLASNLNAAVVAPDIVPLNTVYFIPTSEKRAQKLAAFFNSLPVRTFARAIAERAKDAHFRFFGWTMSSLPLPAAWTSIEFSHDLVDSDEIAAKAFGLGKTDMRVLRSFDEWLRS